MGSSALFWLAQVLHAVMVYNIHEENTRAHKEWFLCFVYAVLVMWGEQTCLYSHLPRKESHPSRLNPSQSLQETESALKWLCGDAIKGLYRFLSST